MYITKNNLLVDAQNSRNPFHFAADWKIGHKRYITKNNLLVDVPKSRNHSILLVAVKRAQKVRN